MNKEVFANLTKEEWEKYAGKVLAIDPSNDAILAVADTEEQLEIELEKKINLIEFFHVPKKGSLSIEEVKKQAGKFRNPIRPNKIVD